MEDLRREILRVLPDIRRFAISLTGNTADGDDLLQTTIEKVLVKGVPDKVNVKRWMFRVAKNKRIDDMRSQKVRQDAAQNELLSMSDASDTESMLINRLTLASVIKNIQALPENQRAALSLVAIEGYSYKEVSELLEIPIGTVMSRLARARKALSSLQDMKAENNALHNVTPLHSVKPNK